MILDILRGASLTIWAIVCLLTSPAFARHMRGTVKRDDDWWSLVFLIGAVFVSWGARNVFLPSSHEGAAYSATCAAHVLTWLVGMSVLRKRIERAL